MVEEGIRGGICHAIHRYAKANNKYMKNYDEDEQSSYIQDLVGNNLYAWAMSKKLPVNGFKLIKRVSKIDEDFIKNYDENGDIGYFLNVDIKYLRELHDLHSDLPFLRERMKINKSNKLVCNLYEKNDYVVLIRALKQALKHGLKLKKVHKVLQFNQKAWLKEYIDMNTKLRKEIENDFEKDFFKLMNNAVFGKTMENVSNEIILKSQQRFKIERHNVYTEEINKIALSRNDNKRLQIFGKITSYPYGTSTGKVCKTELLSKVNIK